jgi:DNA-binding MarR family transcriptional regulator
MTEQSIDRLEAQRAFVRALRRSSRLAQAALEKTLSKFQLNYGQWTALRIVVAANEISVGDLSREAEMTSGAMTRLVDCLEERGLVQRYRSDMDRRQVKVLSTPAAAKAVQAIVPFLTTAWSSLLSEMSTDEIAELTAHLFQFAETLETRSGLRVPSDIDEFANASVLKRTTG